MEHWKMMDKDKPIGTVEDLKYENPQVFIALMYIDGRRRESAFGR
jgi:hypothetical protein